jgi:hypothetical protein
MHFRLAAIILGLGLLALSPPAAATDGAMSGSAPTIVTPTHGEKPGSVSPSTRRVDVSGRQTPSPAWRALISANKQRLPDGNVEFCSGPGHQ